MSCRQVRNLTADGSNVSADISADAPEATPAVSGAGPSGSRTRRRPGAGGALVGFVMAAPVAMAVSIIGVALTIVAFFGVRALEEGRAEVEYERVVLEQTTEVRTRVGSNISSMQTLATFLGSGPIPSSAAFATYLDSSGFFGSRLEYDGLVFVENVEGIDGLAELREREIARGDQGFEFRFNPLDSDGGLVVTRAFGSADTEARIGDLLSPALSGAVGEAADTGTTVLRLDTQAQALFPLADPDETAEEGYRSVNGLVVITPIFTAEDEPGLRGALLGRLDLGRLLQRVQGNEGLVALELIVDGRVAASTVASDQRGLALGEPATFTEGDRTTFSVQGYNTGYRIPRNQSGSVLTGGLALSAVLAWIGRATREHALTLGRLERSEYDVRHDVLTGLLNRAGLTIELSRRVENRKPPEMVGVLFLDLDRLKIVNDSIGHTAGDEVLAIVAQRFRSIIEEGDIIGRFGGDEFVIVPARARSVRDLTRLADSIIEVLSEPCMLSDRGLQMISASIGISWSAEGESTAESMLRDADVAMYRAKDAGGNRWVVFDADLREQALARLEVERELRQAISEGQLVVHYQAIVSTSDGTVDKLEALVRWQHPERGMIPPGQFLGVAAETGLIVDVGEHVLREACRQAADWSELAGRPITVSVNVAERQLIDPGLVKTVRNVLNETGLNANQLELEITEELIIERLDHRLSILRQLARMGVLLAIDDFGTGRASLSQLRHLEMVHTLKVDRAFVENVATNETDQKILTAIVALAESVGMETVAEGVEDADQATRIKEQGVALIQGFYFHRPTDASNIPPVLVKSFDLPWVTASQQSFFAAGRH